MRGVGNMAYSIFVELTPPSLRDTSPYLLIANKTQGRSDNALLPQYLSESDKLHLSLVPVLH